MSGSEQNKTKAPRPFTQEEIQRTKEFRAEHKKMMETDPEYRKQWEKKTKIFGKITLFNDSTPE